jgi:tetratricopeptide (TPR) repeat protein
MSGIRAGTRQAPPALLHMKGKRRKGETAKRKTGRRQFGLCLFSPFPPLPVSPWRSVRWCLGLVLIASICLSPGVGYTADDATAGIQLFDTGRWIEAERFFATFIERHPTDAAAAFYLGRSHFSQEHYEEAVRWLERAVLLEGQNSDYHLWLGRACGHLAQRLSFLWQLPLARKVRIHFEKAVELNPDNLDARADLVEYYLKAPRILGGGREKAEVQAHEISLRDLDEGLRAWDMIAEETAKPYQQAEQLPEQGQEERSDMSRVIQEHVPYGLQLQLDSE